MMELLAVVAVLGATSGGSIALVEALTRDWLEERRLRRAERRARLEVRRGR